MATEDPDKMDELLKRYAKERREQGGDFALHEATRRMLQGEVARQFRAREPEADGAKGGFFFWLGLWRGRLALGGAVAAAVVLGVLMLGPGRKREATMQLAKNDNFADESRLMERENLRLGETDKARAAGQPSAPALAQGLSFEADRKPVEQLAKLKESEVATVTASGSLTPVQSNPAEARAKGLSDAYAAVPKQKTEALFAFMPSPTAAPTALGMQTNSSATLAPNDSGKVFYERNGAGGPPASLAFSPGSPPVTARYAVVSTNATSMNQTGGIGPATALGVQPQVAYGAKAGAVSLAAALNEQAPRPAISEPPALPREVTLLRAAEKPATLSRDASTVATAGPASVLAPAPQADSFGVDRRMALASEEQKARSRAVTGLSTAASGALAAGAKGDAMVFFRQDARGLQESLSRNTQRSDLVRVQTDAVPEKSDTAPEVLSQFTVELDGDTIRVTDADQSVYEGAISNEVVVAEFDSAKDATLDDKVRTEKRALSKTVAPVSGAARNYSFRAVGSNVTLKQVVVVNGRVSGADGLARGVNRPAEMSGAAPAPAVAPAPTRGRVSTAGAGTRGATAFTTNAALTIDGTVRVGSTNEQPFRAVRLPR